MGTPIKQFSDSTDPAGTSGVEGSSTIYTGVHGYSSAKYHAGVAGVNTNQDQEAGPGVYGKSRGTGVWGESETWNGVYGESKSTTGGAGVYGKSNTGCGVIAYNSNFENLATPALYVKKEPRIHKHEHPDGGSLQDTIEQGTAAQFEGHVLISGDLIINGKSIYKLLEELKALIRERG